MPSSQRSKSPARITSARTEYVSFEKDPLLEDTTTKKRRKSTSIDHPKPELQEIDATTNLPWGRTLTFDELLPWQKDNIYIKTGYRPLTNSYRRCLQTLLFLHNETGNILSHFSGMILFLCLFFGLHLGDNLTLRTSNTLEYSNLSVMDIALHPTNTLSDYVAISFFLVAGISCLGLSAFFHTFICHSRQVCLMWNKADYVGIVVMITGSMVPTIWYSLACDATFRALHLSIIAFCGVATLIMCLSPHFTTPHYRVFRTSMFIALGLSGTLPFLHSLYLHGYSVTTTATSASNLFLMGFLYILGAVIYASRVPERWYPGSFDYWGHSHQIFHCLVVAAAWVHWDGVKKSWAYRHLGEFSCKA
ncbi:hemolysin-III related-domain-containing protein [Gaertneriomyces semiglobifer]|nr:hemolysin-III related-domain-containing protein [Gaertneriomyces semiglobifer]